MERDQGGALQSREAGHFPLSRQRPDSPPPLPRDHQLKSRPDAELRVFHRSRSGHPQSAEERTCQDPRCMPHQWATSSISWPTSPTISCTLRTLGLRRAAGETCLPAGTSGRFGSCVHLSENRGVPGSSPGLAMPETRMVSRESVFRVSASVLESGARSGPDLGLGPENSLRGPIGRARALIDTGVSRRLESNRPRFPSLWCRVRVGTPRSADPAQPRWHSTRVVSELAVGQAGEWRSGRGAAATHPRHALAARPALGRSHARRRSGPESPQPIHALLHSNASVRPRRRVLQRAGRRARDAPQPDYDSASPRSSSAATMAPDSDCCFPSEASARLAPDETPVARPGRASHGCPASRPHPLQQRAWRSGCPYLTVSGFRGSRENGKPKRTHLQPKRVLVTERSGALRHKRSPTGPKTPAPRKSPRHASLD